MPAVLVRPRESSDLTKADHGRTLRLDIEGMRTIAVCSVLAFHAGVPFAKGGFVGVDVFFVLSGYLITGLLAREVSRTGHLRIGHFWARRVKRLLPASATVLAFSGLVTYIYLPITQRADFGGDVRAAALYVVNWRFADRAVDYLGGDVGASPVQHYWSLSVEEQFYLIWPLLMLIVATVAAERWRHGAFAILGLVTTISFAYSVAQSQVSPETAFFVSTTRIWELGAGALLALSAVRVGRLPSVWRAAGGWAGIALIAYAVGSYDGSTVWPGAAALVPVAGAALMIASGIAPTPGSPQRLLSLRPMVWIGGLSYSIYLWHWPLLVAAHADHPDLRIRWAVLLMVLSVVPAWLCHRYIEDPIRFGTFFRPTGRALGLGVGLTAIGVLVGLALNASVDLGHVMQEAPRSKSPGAAVLTDRADRHIVWSKVASVKHLRPLPQDAKADRPPSYDDGSGCQVPLDDPKLKTCVHGDKTASRTLLVVGDSKIAQWETVLDRLGKREGWRLLTLNKNACPFTAAEITGRNHVLKDCASWGRQAMSKILRTKPAVVLTANRFQTALPPGKTDGHDRTRAAMVDGLVSYWRKLHAAGIPVVSVLDNPMPTTHPVYECVAEHPDNLPACAYDLAQGVAQSGAPAQLAAVKRVPGVEVIDMTRTVCPDNGRCPAVIGNVLVYRDGSHLTRTFVDSAEPQFAAQLARATHGAFGTGDPSS